MQTREIGKITFLEKVSYGLLDTAGQLVFAFVTTFMLYYYTDVAGISVVTAGIILLVARVIDAFDAPIWGLVIDRTNSKFGKARPYFLWLALPLALFGVATFCVPNLSTELKIAYAAMTYALLGITYTGINTPLTSILPLMTNNPKERLVLNSFRGVGSLVGVFIVNATALPLVKAIGHGDERLGFAATVLIFAVASIALNWFGFANIRERQTDLQIGKVTVKQSLKAANNNWPWIIIVVSNLIFWTAFTTRTSTLIYYFEYNLHDKDMATVMQSVSVVSIIAVLCMPFLCNYFSQTAVWIGGLVVAVLGQIAVFAAGTNATLLIASWILANLGSGIAISLPFALIGIAVEYGQAKSGVNASGFLAAIGASFCIKAGSGLGGFIPSMIMGKFGYQPGVAQTASSLAGIQIVFILVPAILFLLAAVPVLFFKKFEGSVSSR